MKGSLIHQSTVLGLLSSSLLGPLMLGSTPAIALPAGDVSKKLERVPVFGLTDAKGALLGRFASDPKDQKKKVEIATFFVNHQDAQTAVNQLKSSKNEVGKTAKIAPASLSKVYQAARQSKESKENFAVSIVPKKQEMETATTLLKQSGQQAGQIDVPLFYGVVSKGNQKFYLSLQQGNASVTPFYFSKQDLQQTLDQLKKDPQQAKVTTQIQVASLSSVITFLEKENTPLAKQVTLVPASETLKYVVSQQQPAPPKAAAPAAPKK